MRFEMIEEAGRDAVPGELECSPLLTSAGDEVDGVGVRKVDDVGGRGGAGGGRGGIVVEIGPCVRVRDLAGGGEVEVLGVVDAVGVRRERLLRVRRHEDLFLL